ncbi:MAG: hypothetical protein JKX85_10445, partial [Phycisphaeraceae bacterium]|nr:hypothetical protein [Phycisphaeraceae bacterium]
MTGELTQTINQHTPGPWIYDPYGLWFSIACNDNRPEYTMRMEHAESVSEEEELANIKLISLAPKFLEHLQYIDSAAPSGDDIEHSDG